MEIAKSIQSHIFEVRGKKIMADKDLAALYGVETKVFNQAVKRNINRFPEDFMFQLTKAEYDDLRSQIVTSSHHGGTRYLPYVFTEQGIAMLSGVLTSDKAVKMNIAIMRAFVEVRRILMYQNDLKEQLQIIKDRLGEHDVQLNQIYDAMENLLDEKVMQSKWEDRQRIGFQK